MEERVAQAAAALNLMQFAARPCNTSQDAQQKEEVGRTDLEHKMSLTGNCSKQLFDISFVLTLWKNMISKKVQMSDVELITSITCT